MKKNLIFGLLFGLALAVSFSSCKKDEDDPTPPASVVADFTMSPAADLTTGVAITFTNISIIPESAGTATYAWDFGDGTGTSTEENPVYTYSSAGNFTIKLTISTPNADDAVKTMDITVALADAVVANFSIDPAENLVAPVEITFTNTSTIPATAGTATYAWDFGDGSGTSTDENPVYTYSTGGHYTITLTITTPNADDAVKTMDISVISEVIFEEDFEGYSPDETAGAYLPGTWAVIDLDGGVPDDPVLYDAAWKIASSDRMGSDIAVATSYYGSPYPSANDWMITPQIAIQANTYLSFDAMSLTSSGDYPDHYEVYISTTTQDADGCLDATNGKLIHYKYPETWTEGLTNSDGVTGEGIQSYELDLSEFAGQNVYIGFRLMTPDAYGSELGVDNIKVYHY
jgi:PKD repeat protein